MNLQFRLFVILLSALAFISGCASRPRSVSEKRTYLLQVTRADTPPQSQSDNCLHVRLCRTAAAFSGNQFVYRTGPYLYEKDYYNGFLSPPDDQITEIISKWIRDSEMFVCVQGTETITLEPHLDVLCVDFQDKQKPYVHVQMHFNATRMDKSCTCPVTVLDKDYAAKITLLQSVPSGNDIISAMSNAFQQILIQLEGDLANNSAAVQVAH